MPTARARTVRDVVIGAAFRDLRANHRANHSGSRTLTEAARAMGWSAAAMSRVEKGLRPVDAIEAAQLLALYGVTGERRAAFLRLVQGYDNVCWLVPEDPGRAISEAMADFEDSASRVTYWAPGYIPWPLQTPAYTRTLLRLGGMSTADTEATVRGLGTRKDALHATGQRRVSFIAESVLVDTINDLGHDEQHLRRRQLERLLRPADATVRVVPMGAPRPLHPAWTLITRDSHVTAYLDLGGPRLYTFSEAVQPYVDARDRLDEIALGIEESALVIQALARGHYF